MNTCRLYLIRHAPVKKKDGYVPENNPKAIINSDHLKKLAAHIFQIIVYVMLVL